MSMNKFSNNILPVLIVGSVEGIIIPLSLYSFLVGKHAFDLMILYTVLASLVFLLFFTFGAYFTRKEELDHNKDSKLLKIYQSLDIDGTLQDTMAEDAKKEKELWVTEWKENENATLNFTPKSYCLTIMEGYLIGLIITIINIISFDHENYHYLMLPTIVLFILGYIKYKMANKNAIVGMIMIGGAGLLAGICSYYFGRLFI